MDERRGELQATIYQIAIYCGIPANLNCQRVAVQVLAEIDPAG